MWTRTELPKMYDREVMTYIGPSVSEPYYRVDRYMFKGRLYQWVSIDGKNSYWEIEDG